MSNIGDDVRFFSNHAEVKFRPNPISFPVAGPYSTTTKEFMDAHLVHCGKSGHLLMVHHDNEFDPDIITGHTVMCQDEPFVAREPRYQGVLTDLT